MVIAPNGTFVGEPGYPRGNIKRSEPGFGDPPMVHLITGSPTDPMCKDSQKSPSSQSASSPRLKAAPGADIALRFQENGHVTLPQAQPGKAENRGDVFVYGTTQPKDNELFNDVHGVWTADGKGGDGRGVLLAKAAYDDGQCYQVNGGAISAARQKQFAHPTSQLMGGDLWCQTDVRLPSDAPTGKPYTLYWVWEWPTAPGIDPGLPKGKNETYTTCMDADISDPGVAGDVSQKVASDGFAQGQPVENAAVPAQFAKLGEQAAAPATAQSLPSSAPASSASVASTQAAAAVSSAPSMSAPTSITPIPGSDALPAPAPHSSASSAPPLAPPVAGPNVSPGSNLTTISPIPGPEAASAPPSVALTTALSSSTTPLTMVIVTQTDVVTFTNYVTVSATAVPSPSAAPRIRGRNAIFRLRD